MKTNTQFRARVYFTSRNLMTVVIFGLNWLPSFIFSFTLCARNLVSVCRRLFPLSNHKAPFSLITEARMWRPLMFPPCGKPPEENPNLGAIQNVFPSELSTITRFNWQVRRWLSLRNDFISITFINHDCKLNWIIMMWHNDEWRCDSPSKKKKNIWRSPKENFTRKCQLLRKKHH